MNSRNLILIILALGLFYSFSSPIYQETKILSASAAEYRSVLENISHIAETRDALLVKYQAIPQKDVNKLERILPNNVDSVRIAYDLDTIGARYGIAIKDVKVSTEPSQDATLAVIPNPNQRYNTATVVFSFVSTYPNFLKMLADLERSLRIMDVRSIIFQTDDSGVYEHTVTVETYWLK